MDSSRGKSNEAPPRAGSAPEPLRHVIDLVNTRRLDGDEIGTPEALANWLQARGMTPGEVAVTAVEHAHALAVREGLRAVLARNNRGPGREDLAPSGRPDGLDPAALSRLAALARGLPLVLDLASDPPRLVPSADGTVDSALASVLAIVAGAVANGTWARMKTCWEPSCRWAYYDQSRNRSRAWCSMNVCGNRSKVRSFRRRGEVPQRDATGPGGRPPRGPSRDQEDGGFTPNM